MIIEISPHVALEYINSPTHLSGKSAMAHIRAGAKYILCNVRAPDSCLDLSGGDNRSSMSNVAFVYCFAQQTLAVIGFPPHNGPNQQVIVVCILWRCIDPALQWLFEQQQNGNFQIKSATGPYLMVNGSPANGVRVVAGQAPFEWHVEDDPSVPQAIR